MFAQESINYESISGRVTDPSGAVVQGAHVVARETSTNLASEATTDDEGRFRFPYLRVGQYEIKANQEGFAERARTLTATVGAELPVPLTIASRTMDVIVTVRSPARIRNSALSPLDAMSTRHAFQRCYRFGHQPVPAIGDLKISLRTGNIHPTPSN
ncbi:MAG: carboxypeptidase regulatory-like domain-containing protein [Bryobacterales bacterium]|nr:carboxypeptidase regulatory-like domain-containing protein [Bryobacterales bacterium]